MASKNCWRCLSTSRPAVSPLLPRSLLPLPHAAALFSTTSAANAKPAPKGGVKKGVPKLRKPGEQTTFKRRKKNIPQKTGKAPMPGERKASRKRVVLSNTNALEVAWLKDFDGAMLEEIIKTDSLQTIDGPTEPENASVLGKVVGLTGESVDALRAVDAFKSNQGWGLFNRPGVLLREESVGLSRRIVGAEKGKSVLRLVVDGDKGAGKSLMLVHALATAHLRGWILVTIPEGMFICCHGQYEEQSTNCHFRTAQEVTNAVTPYSPLPSTSPTQYSQNVYIINMFTQLLKANKPIFEKLNTTIDLNTLPIPIKEKTITLARLCELGARDPDVAWPMFEAFWKEITCDGRPPLMFTLDGLNHVLRNSEYRNTKYEPIHSLDLAIVRKFTDLLSGTATLPNGGAIIAATSRSHAPVVKSLTLAIQQQEDRQAGREVTKLDPFEREYDARAEAALKGAQVLKLGGIKKNEARGLMEYWAHSGVYRGLVDERSVAEKWAVAGSGIVGEIERATLRMRI